MNRSLFLVFFGAAACAVGHTDNPGTDDGGVVATKHDGGADAGKKTPPSTSDSGTPPNNGDASLPVVDDQSCAALTSKSDCEQCCLTVHPAGYQVYHTVLLSCLCQAPASCASECATEYCGNSPTTSGDACEVCISAALDPNTGSCYGAMSSTCQGDSDCTALFQGCIPPCENK